MAEGHAAYEKQVQIYNSTTAPTSSAIWTANAGSNWIDFDFLDANWDLNDEEADASMNRSGDGGRARIYTLTDSTGSVNGLLKATGEDGFAAQSWVFQEKNAKNPVYLRYLHLGAGAGFPVVYGTYLASTLSFSGGTAGSEDIAYSFNQMQKAVLTVQT